jgi:hypothetical protein
LKIKLNKNEFSVFYKLFDINKNGDMISLCGSTNAKKKVFEIGQIYRVNGKVSIAENGFHFCKDIKELKTYASYLARPDVAICEIEVIGDLISDKNQKTFCSNKIKILRKLDRFEIYDLLDKCS